MKRNNKKGFTIVELVIVIAVIAILSAVLIPTFGGVTNKAQEAARDSEAKNIYTQYMANWDYTTGDPADGYIFVDDYYYTVTKGSIDIENESKNEPTTITNHINHVDVKATGATHPDHNCDVCGAPNVLGEHKVTSETDENCAYCGKSAK